MRERGISKRIINVSNRLPVQVGRTITKSSGGLVSALEGVADRCDLHWIGWTGEVAEDAAERRRVREQLAGMNYAPVFLDAQTADDYYLGFANSSTWPLLHYMTMYAEFEDRWERAYVRANEAFAEAVADVARDGDLVWVHDYHLMLLPSMLKRRNQRLKVGFFLHTPFPSFEVFRGHPSRELLLRGLLGADLIGFHTFGYLRHFRSSLLRILGLDSEVDSVVHDGYESRMGVYPIGINAPAFVKALETEAFAEQLAEYEGVYEGKRLVLSVERMDYTKGIPRKLAAIEQFLENHPDERQTTTFVIIAVPSREGVEQYQQLIEEVEHAIGRINGAYSTMTHVPIHFVHRGVAFHELCALYRRADAALVTPLMDGMNLVAKEYVACQGDDPGVLILSETAGAAQELSNAWMVNPYHVQGVAEAIHGALRVGRWQRRSWIAPMRDRVLEQDAAWWANRFLDDLDRTDPVARMVMTTKPLTPEAVEPFRARAGRKALFLDYDGTLTELVRDPEAAAPGAALLETLEALIGREDLRVFVVSGRDHHFLDKHLGHLPLTLVGEHGYTVREPGEGWRLFNEQVDLSWKDKVRDIFELYAETTPGSSVEVKTSAIVWHYRKSDPEFGKWKAAELVGELMESISNLPVGLHQGKMIVEVSSQQVSKGEALRAYLQAGRFDRVLAIGDDQTDETMFALRADAVVTVKVGLGDTNAEYRVGSPAQVRKVLADIARGGA